MEFVGMLTQRLAREEDEVDWEGAEEAFGSKKQWADFSLLHGDTDGGGGRFGAYG